MRKAVFALTAIIALVFLVDAITQSSLVAANFLPAPSIEIVYPNYLQPYQSNLLTAQIDARVLDNTVKIISINYSLDDNPYICITNLTESSHVTFGPSGYGYVISTVFVLDNLSEGNHTLKAYSLDSSGKNMSTSTPFSVDANYWSPYTWDKQKVLLLSPENKTYPSSEIPLVFVMNGEIQRAYYFLDSYGREPISAVGNVTLTGLWEGSHRIYISASNGLGGFATQAASFNIGSTEDDNPDVTQNDNPSPAENQTNTPMIVVSIAIITVAVAMGADGLLVYFKKFRRSLVAV